MLPLRLRAMLAKIGNWAWLGGAVLAAIAGMINAIGFLSYSHQAVTHLTGTVSLLSLAIFDRRNPETLHLLGVITAFFLGAILSGVIIQRQTLKLGRRYGVALAIEGVLLAVAALLMRNQLDYGSYFASAAYKTPWPPPTAGPSCAPPTSPVSSPISARP